MQAGYTISIHYLVLSTKGGTQMDIGMTLKVVLSIIGISTYIRAVKLKGLASHR